MELELPLPPSVNRLWRRVGARTLLSREGRSYRSRIHRLLAARGVQPLAGRLAVAIEVHPPDRRRRDLDNLQKALLDSMQHGGVYFDDSQIDELCIRRCEQIPGGLVQVCVTLLEAPEPEAKPKPEANPKVKPRTCLKCGDRFLSKGPANRICSPCRRDNNQLDLSEAEVQKQRGVKRHTGELRHPSVEC